MTPTADKSSDMIRNNIKYINNIIFVGNQRILETSSAKFLGITIDNKFNFNPYINSVLSKGGRVSG